MNRLTRIAVTGVVALLTATAAQAQVLGQKGNPGKQGPYYTGIGQRPWFSNLQIRQHFKLTDQQYQQLDKNYQESYGRYQQDMNSWGKDLSVEQRSQKMRDLHHRFNQSFSTTANEVFTEPEQRQRYNQLYLQYQGYNAFSDPSVQGKLNLTVEQRNTLSQYGQEWHTQMNDFGRTYATDPEGTTKQFHEMRKQSGERINTVLTPEQQKSWRQLTGESYEFQPNIYFQTNVGGGTGTKKDNK